MSDCNICRSLPPYLLPNHSCCDMCRITTAPCSFLAGSSLRQLLSLPSAATQRRTAQLVRSALQSTLDVQRPPAVADTKRQMDGRWEVTAGHLLTPRRNHTHIGGHACSCVRAPSPAPQEQPFFPYITMRVTRCDSERLDVYASAAAEEEARPLGWTPTSQPHTAGQTASSAVTARVTRCVMYQPWSTEGCSAKLAARCARAGRGR